MNFSYLQALDGICRDEITVNSDQLKAVYQGQDQLITEKKMIQVFDQAFSSSRSVQFTFNPNMR